VVQKYEPTGSPSWSRMYQYTKADISRGNAIALDQYGQVYVAGYYWVDDGAIVPPYEDGNFAVWRLDNDGYAEYSCDDPYYFGPECAPEVYCSDGYDNDADDLIDCDDSDCADLPECCLYISCQQAGDRMGPGSCDLTGGVGDCCEIFFAPDEFECVGICCLPVNPLCAPFCFDSFIGDGWCDPDCYTLECTYDGGDCDLCAATGCDISKLGNRECDAECNNAECFDDFGDCF
jgi:hypothetical protein